MIHVYPNPATSFLKIESGNNTNSYSARILTMEGRTVRTKSTLNSSRQIELSGLTEGMYFLELFLDEVSVGVYKFIKK